MPLIPVRGPMPGDFTYTAQYDDVEGGTLTLTAEGGCPAVAYDFNFEPLVSIGGLRFAFTGMIGPALPPPPFSVNFRQDLRIPKSPYIPIPHQVFIVDEAHPAGIPVDVKFNWIPPPVSNSLVSSKQLATTDLSQLIVRPPIRMVIFLGETVELKAPVNPEGVVMNYSQEKLDLVDAGINTQNEIYWKFKTIATGNSLVSATSGFGFGNETVWEIICIGLTDNPSDIAGNNFVPFLEGLGLAVDKVRKQYKDAELYNVDIAPRRFGPEVVHSPYQLNWLVATFLVDDGNNTVEIRSIGSWAVWGDAIFFPGRRIGLDQMKWPLEGGLDLSEAFSLVTAADPKKKGVKSASLFQLTNPSVPPEIQGQPAYHFIMAGGEQWAVGSVTKKPVPIGFHDINDEKANGAGTPAALATAPPAPLPPIGVAA